MEDDQRTVRALSSFTPAVAEWFASAFHEPTDIQARAWEAIRKGDNTLVIAPTGSGKTLAAFLSAIDAIAADKAKATGSAPRAAGTRILYVSPLKALGADVERNLSAPLAAIAARQAAASDASVAQITVGVRTGDTPPSVRARLVRNPPDILITTPESLYLMLTSKARSALSTIQTVIVDELHSIAGTKRGTHFSLSLERLDALLKEPAQRIGLSATIKPVGTAAKFLGGTHPVSVVQDDSPPAFDLSVIVPVKDMTNVQPFTGSSGFTGMHPTRKVTAQEAWKTDSALKAHLRSKASQAGAQAADMANADADASTSTSPNAGAHTGTDVSGSAADASPQSVPDTRLGSATIWPYIESSVLDQVLAHKSTIVFVNSRGVCEHLTARLNEAYAKRQGRTSPSSAHTLEGMAIRSEMRSTTLLVAASEEPIAKAHHGSVSKEHRQRIEHELKSGQLRCVVATSSLELGIDMGEVDLVIQVAAPFSVSSGLQRIGRANHQVDGKSLGLIYPRTRHEILDTAFVTEGMFAGTIEETRLVEDALDVLAQQTAAEVAAHPEGLDPDAWYGLVRRSACYEHLGRAPFDAVIAMLAGASSLEEGAAFAPRVDYDRAAGLLKPLPRTQKLAINAAGTIPDRGLYPVMLATGSEKGGRKRVGELDEEMVHESRIGDVIILGTSTWRITEITNDRVVVAPAPGRTARLPFWHGEGTGRSLEAGRRRGALQRRLSAATGKDGTLDDPLASELSSLGFDENGLENLGSLIALQRSDTGALPSDELVILEVCPDETGAWYLVIHSPFGKRVHEPWALAISQRMSARYGFDPQSATSDDGIILRIPFEEDSTITPDLVQFAPDEIADIVSAAVTGTALFAGRFRECAARALLMGTSAPGKRTPLWQQRMRAGQLLEAVRYDPSFPIYIEAIRECLDDVYDLHGLCALMEDLETRTVTVRVVRTERPSPFASPLLFGYVADHIYDLDMPHGERNRALLSVDPDLLGELLGMPDALALLEPDALAEVQLELQRVIPHRKLSGREGAAELLRQLGPLTEEEMQARLILTTAPEGEDAASAPALIVAQLLDDLEAQHRACALALDGQRIWATPEDGLRLRGLRGGTLPEWVEHWADALPPADREARAGTALAAKLLSSHSLASATQMASWLGVGHDVAEDALRALEAKGTAKRLSVSTAARSIITRANDQLEDRLAAEDIVPQANVPLLPTEDVVWVSRDILKRLRLRSRDVIEEAVKPVDAGACARLILRLQGLDGHAHPSPEDALADCISLFEGVAYPPALWEAVIFPARVPGYRPALLDDLLGSEEVLWTAVPDAGKPAHTMSVALFPTDSPFAPERVDPSMGTVEPMTSQAIVASDHPGAPDAAADPLKAELLSLLCREGSMTCASLAQRMQALSADEPVSLTALGAALKDLAREGRITSTTFGFPRTPDAAPAKATRAKAPSSRRRVSSRRAAYRSQALAESKRAFKEGLVAGRQSLEALEGTWSALAAPFASPTEEAIAAVESILDRYGVVCPKTIDAAGLKGGMQGVYAVLRGMEDAGEVVRGEFVEGLGASQFARRNTVEELRSAPGESSMIVLAGNDPAMIYGSILPWPSSPSPVAPAAKEGCLVVLEGGIPVLFASKRLKELITFTADEATLDEAACTLIRSVEDTLRRGPASRMREKHIVERLDGESIYGTPLEKALATLGLIRDTHGMRLYVQPFL